MLEDDKQVAVYLVYSKQLVDVNGAGDGKVMCYLATPAWCYK